MSLESCVGVCTVNVPVGIFVFCVQVPWYGVYIPRSSTSVACCYFQSLHLVGPDPYVVVAYSVHGSKAILGSVYIFKKSHVQNVIDVCR